MKTLLPLRPLSNRRNPWKRSLRVSQVLHLQCPQGQVPQKCPHGQFLTLLLLLQSPQLLLQSPQLLRSNPQHLCILPRVKGQQASLLPQELLLVLSCTEFFNWSLSAEDKGHCWTRFSPKSSQEAGRLPSAV